MIKFQQFELDSTNKVSPRKSYPISIENGGSITIDGAELIPIDFGGRLVAPTPNVSVTELGKQLLKAAAEGDAEELKSLLSKGAPFTADWLGTSPLHLAAQNNQLEICEILLRSGISKDSRTKVDRTPLHMAAYEGHLEIVAILLNHGADLESKDLLGMRPIHWAVQNGHIEVVKVLLATGCNLNVTNKFNLTPVDIAAQIFRNDIIELLSSDSHIAAENLVIQLQPENGDPCAHYQILTEQQSDQEEMELEYGIEGAVPVETILMDDDDNDAQMIEPEADDQIPETIHLEAHVGDDLTGQNHENFSASMKILQDHGITMLPTDEGNILNSVMESGHSVVLTDVGKEVLNSFKQQENAEMIQNKKIITVTADEFLSMTNSQAKKNSIKKYIFYKPDNTITGKRIMMKKNKVVPIVNTTQISQNQETTNFKEISTDMELVMTQLIEARKTIEEYKIKLRNKEKEAERYKQQLKLLMDAS